VEACPTKRLQGFKYLCRSPFGRLRGRPCEFVVNNISVNPVYPVQKDFFALFRFFSDFVINSCLLRNAFISRRARYVLYGDVDGILAECVCCGLAQRPYIKQQLRASNKSC
jgi:hypothetical protein